MALLDKVVWETATWGREAELDLQDQTRYLQG